jgi:hypothetical protein
MIDRGFLLGGDGEYDDGVDRPASFGREVGYELTGSGRDFLDDLGVELPQSRRPLIRYCIDWTETRHHLAGRLGRGLLDRFLELGWVERTGSRALRISAEGAEGFAREFGVG